jgi:hypothetical protein
MTSVGNRHLGAYCVKLEELLAVFVENMKKL